MNYEVALLQLSLYIVLGVSRKIHVKFITVCSFLYVGLHQTVNRKTDPLHRLQRSCGSVGSKHVIKKIIKQITIKNSRHQHKSFLLLSA